MKKNILGRLGVLAVGACLISTSLMSGTLAKYTTTVSGTDTATVASFDFSVLDKDGLALADSNTIDLFDDITPAGANTVANDLIAPGCSGDFLVDINCAGSEVDIDLTSTVTVANDNTIPVKFAIAESAPDDDGYTIAQDGLATALQNAIDGEVKHDDTSKDKDVKVFWKWVDGQGDPADTTLGAMETAPTFKLDIEVTATQAMDDRA